ncbi:MAG TPA: hypothetical protein V6C95_16920, partial [Coleofasciculaceae cyanobacterium]
MTASMGRRRRPEKSQGEQQKEGKERRRIPKPPNRVNPTLAQTGRIPPQPPLVPRPKLVPTKPLKFRQTVKQPVTRSNPPSLPLK